MKKTIAVVDDNTQNLSLISDILTHSGYRVIKIQDGSKALDAVESHKPALIIMDLMLNDGILGTDLVKELKSKPGFNTPVIGCTSEMSRMADKLRHICDGFVQKPFSIEELVTEVHKF